MSVAEIGQLHSRYVKLSDKFKSIWTYHQFAAGVFKNLLGRDLPYSIEFPLIFETLKKAGDVIQTSAMSDASSMMDATERELARVVVHLLRADQDINPPILRRFFEKLKKHDEKILFNLIKFYLYADAVTGDCRDKLDYLLTRCGEEFSEERSEYWTRDSLELRKQFQALVSVRPARLSGQVEIISVIRILRTLRDEIMAVESFERLVETGLLEKERTFKHKLEDNYFHPDVLLAVIELNVSTKNQFTRLYRIEEQRILEDSKKLLDHEQAISRGFGAGNPQLLEELVRFRQFKMQFDQSIASSNLKHDEIARLKSSITNVLAQLDRGLDSRSPEAPADDLSSRLFMEARQTDALEEIFGDDPLLGPYLLRIFTALQSFDGIDEEEIVKTPEVQPLRLEPWEAAAYFSLRAPHRSLEDASEELLLLFVRSAALRMRIDEQACVLAAVPASSPADKDLMEGVRESLDRAKELDKTFGELLQDLIHYSRSNELHRLYRSRFRLLRGFSGLWLIYDKRAAVE